MNASSLTNEDFEVECKRRIHVLLCSIHQRKNVNLSKVQGIMGDFVDAEVLIDHMLEKKTIMPMGENCYEFTYKGLTEFYENLLPKITEKLGHRPNEDELLKAVFAEAIECAE